MAILIHKDSVHQDAITALKAIHPSPAIHDDVHYYFVSATDEAMSLIPADKLHNVDAWDLSGDELAWQVTTILTTDDNAVLVLDIYTGDQLFHHAAWRIWCANYNDENGGRKQFKANWQYIKEMVVRMNPETASLWPEYNEQMSYTDGKQIIYNFISSGVEK